MKKIAYSLSILLVVICGCKKEEKNDPAPTPTGISGVWKVDSVVTERFMDNNPNIRSWEVNLFHSLDFSVDNFVIQKIFTDADTTAFTMINQDRALSDLDFNQQIDTTFILTKVPDKSIELEWVPSRYTSGNIEYKTVMTMYLSK